MYPLVLGPEPDLGSRVHRRAPRLTASGWRARQDGRKSGFQSPGLYPEPPEAPLLVTSQFQSHVRHDVAEPERG